MNIESFEFNQSGKEKLEKLSKGKDWPVVYLINNDKDLYIGETTSAYTRFGQHLANPEKAHLNKINIIFDDTYNKSVILDYEQKLIKYCKSDKKYKILNKNVGQSALHNYYERDEYAKDFKTLWQELFQCGLVQNSMDILENKNIFKFSPYNTLTEEQNAVSISVLNDIYDKFKSGKKGISLINGCAGTGKTVLAISIINSLVNTKNFDENDFTNEELESEKVKALLKIKEYVKKHGDFKIGFVFPMTGIRKTVATVFKESGNGLSAKMVISPFSVKNQKYDILFVDESHRLMRRKNLSSPSLFNQFDDVCNALSINPDDASQLDWVLKQSKYTVLFYDKNQSIKSTDVTYSQYQQTLTDYKNDGVDVLEKELTTQMRCEGGDSFISYVKAIFSCQTGLQYKNILNYDFKLFKDVDVMVKSVRNFDNKIGLSKTVAGYSWQWNTKLDKPSKNMTSYNQLVAAGKYDIDIQGHKYIWNLVTEDWISRDDSHYTIGCIHTTQGFDTNYIGVILGEEIDYDPMKNEIVVNLKKFYDTKVKSGCSDDVVKQFIINTYTTMMARGIKGCYVYACNKNLREYLEKFINY